MQKAILNTYDLCLIVYPILLCACLLTGFVKIEFKPTAFELIQTNNLMLGFWSLVFYTSFVCSLLYAYYRHHPEETFYFSPQFNFVTFLFLIVKLILFQFLWFKYFRENVGYSIFCAILVIADLIIKKIESNSYQETENIYNGYLTSILANLPLVIIIYISLFFVFYKFLQLR